jgi:hypothetical protein
LAPDILNTDTCFMKKVSFSITIISKFSSTHENWKFWINGMHSEARKCLQNSQHSDDKKIMNELWNIKKEIETVGYIGICVGIGGCKYHLFHEIILCTQIYFWNIWDMLVLGTLKQELIPQALRENSFFPQQNLSFAPKAFQVTR